MLFRKLDRFWRDLSVSRKLYAVVGLMTFLVAFELITLKYTMNLMSSVRGFVAGEGLWSKAQKDALLEMNNYIVFRDEKYYHAFLNHLAVPLGDRAAREELARPNPDYEYVYQSFLKGRNHPKDIRGMIHLLRYYGQVSYVQSALEAWVQGDGLIDEILLLGQNIRNEVRTTPTSKALRDEREILAELSALNARVTTYADRFSFSLGEASRWIEGTLFLLLLLMILGVQCLCLFFVMRFGRNLLRTLDELNTAADKIGTGDFSRRLQVHSKDELGHLAASLNRMTENLQNMSGKKDQAEEANQVKSLFLANMSHEIRTPLGAILGFVELLKEPDLSERNRKQYLDIISRTGDTLVTIINDILDLSKVEAGKLEVVKEVFSLPQVLKDLELLMQLRSEAKGIELRFIAGENSPDFIYSDPMRLRQILTNMIGNAIKFTQKGSVTLQYEVKGHELIFRVSDTGPGVKPQDVPKLFRPFSQGDLSIRKRHGGTGLGLVLSRELARLLEGDVYLESSSFGEGSVFSVRIAYQIPRDLRETSGAPKHRPSVEVIDVRTESQGISGRNILLVEDTPENQILISHILQQSGAQVQVAQNGEEGIKMAESGNYDVVIMDMQMPILDGYSATTQLRQRGYEKPIISLTAHAMREDLRKCLEVGCNDVLTKPINKMLLLKTLNRYCS